MQFSFQIFRFHILFPGAHLVRISTNSINLAVMYDKPIRMRPFPTRIRIRAESGVYQRNCRLIVSILKICKERPKLPHQKHSLISNRPAGKRRHISIVAALFKDTAHHIQPPVKIKPSLRLLWTLYESLHNARHTRRRTTSQYLPLYRNFSPPKEIHPLFLHNHFKDLLCLVSL